MIHFYHAEDLITLVRAGARRPEVVLTGPHFLLSPEIDVGILISVQYRDVSNIAVTTPLRSETGDHSGCG